MDLKLLQGLKEKVTTLNEVCFFLADSALGSVTYWRADALALYIAIRPASQQQVGVNVHDFWVRRPGKETLKFDFKVFDESILCPMVRSLVPPPPLSHLLSRGADICLATWKMFYVCRASLIRRYLRSKRWRESAKVNAQGTTEKLACRWIRR